MATYHAHPEHPAAEAPRSSADKSRRQKPIVSVILAAYVAIAVMQPEQVVYLVVLLPFVFIALDLAFEVTEKLDGR